MGMETGRPSRPGPARPVPDIHPDKMKVAVCEYLLQVNREMDEADAGGGRKFIPPTAIDWLGDGIVRAILSTHTCPHGDVTCPCQDGDPCHYEGPNPMWCPLHQTHHA
jgi:hypothetical protein